MAREIFALLDSDDASLGLVKSFTDDSFVDPPKFVRSDDSRYRIHWLKRNPSPTPGRPFIYGERPVTVKMAAGIIDAEPEGGTFTLTDPAGAQTTAAIAYNASDATVQTAIQAALTTNFSTATVSGDAGGPWTISKAAGVWATEITGNSDGLVPSGSTVNITTTQQGTTLLQKKWQVRLRKALPFLCTSFSSFPTLTFAASLVTAGSSTQKEIHSVSWNADTYEGNCYLQVSTTGSDIETIGPIPYNVTADEFQAILERHAALDGGGLVTVSQSGSGSYTIAFDQSFTSTPTVTVGDNTFKVPIGDEEDIGVATAESDAILAGGTEADMTFEMEVRESSGKPRTIVRAATKLYADLITSTPGQTTGVDNFLTEADLTGGTLALSGTSVKVAGGSAGSPSINFGNTSGDTDTGFYRVGANQIGVAAGGAAVAGIGSEGISAGIFASAGLRATAVTKTADYTATALDVTILCDCTSAAITITLPAAASHAFRIYTIKKIDASGNAVTIDGNASETIDGATTKSLAAQWNTKTIQCNGTAWFILNDL